MKLFYLFIIVNMVTQKSIAQNYKSFSTDKIANDLIKEKILDSNQQYFIIDMIVIADYSNKLMIKKYLFPEACKLLPNVEKYFTDKGLIGRQAIVFVTTNNKICKMYSLNWNSVVTYTLLPIKVESEPYLRYSIIYDELFIRNVTNNMLPKCILITYGQDNGNGFYVLDKPNLYYYFKPGKKLKLIQKLNKKCM